MKRNQGYIIEFVQIGNHIKVSAIDAATGREASIIGAPKASKKELTDLAIQKLNWVMAKKPN
jgi:hypothetical protein